MNTYLKNIGLLSALLAISIQAQAVGLVWGEGNWGDAEWSGEVTEPVAPPEGPIPAATKIRGISNTDAGFSSGAYAATGSPTYNDSFVAGDFITIISEIYPDSTDIGESGDIFVVMLSLVGGEANWSFLNTDGNFEAWDTKLPTLGAAQIIDVLEETHSLTLFEGNLVAGKHRLAVGYMAQGRPLIYSPKAVNIVVSE